MKLYPTLDVKLSYQNFGSHWAIILRGPSEQLEQAANGLYNWGATNGELAIWDHIDMVGTLRSSSVRMEEFFRLQFINQFWQDYNSGKIGAKFNRYMRHNVNVVARAVARQKIKQLRASHEEFFNYKMKRVFDPPEVHDNGTITAERPDTDMKDAILEHAFA